MRQSRAPSSCLRPVWTRSSNSRVGDGKVEQRRSQDGYGSERCCSMWKCLWKKKIRLALSCVDFGTPMDIIVILPWELPSLNELNFRPSSCHHNITTTTNNIHTPWRLLSPCSPPFWPLPRHSPLCNKLLVRTLTMKRSSHLGTFERKETGRIESMSSMPSFSQGNLASRDNIILATDRRPSFTSQNPLEARWVVPNVRFFLILTHFSPTEIPFVLLQPVPPPLPSPWLPNPLNWRRESSLLLPLPSPCSPVLLLWPLMVPTNGSELTTPVFWLFFSLSTGLSLPSTSSNTEITTRRRTSSEKSTTPWPRRNKLNASFQIHEFTTTRVIPAIIFWFWQRGFRRYESVFCLVPENEYMHPKPMGIIRYI